MDDSKIALRINIDEDLSQLANYKDLPIDIYINENPKGFGENHNLTFKSYLSDFFIIVNPDIRLVEIQIDVMLKLFMEGTVGAVAPCVVSPSGELEDSVRYFPTIIKMFIRLGTFKRLPDYDFMAEPINVDWAAGMFVVYRSSAFNSVGGFDERFFMYYEDADICRRLLRNSWRTLLQPNFTVIHNAQRKSHRNMRYFLWHVYSLFRILFLPAKK